MRTDSHSACRSPALIQQSKLRARNLEDAAPGLMYSNCAATDIRCISSGFAIHFIQNEHEVHSII